MGRLTAPLLVLLAGCATLQPAPVEAPARAETRVAPVAKTLPAAKAPAEKAPAEKAPTEKAPAAKAPAAKALAEKAPAKVAAAEPVAKPAPVPTLDLKTLEDQLRATDSIGVLTKIGIKNQVNDLLKQFRAFYEGKGETTLEALRRKYDLLVMKVLGLVQEGDQALAMAVTNSREAIWGILSSRTEFAKI